MTKSSSSFRDYYNELSAEERAEIEIETARILERARLNRENGGLTSRKRPKSRIKRQLN
ncbi:MAG: hypothetical protein FWG64_04375 [Firmicutes bacterium]|nr:hypothetical protein [Bacillota bacterium]